MLENLKIVFINALAFSFGMYLAYGIIHIFRKILERKPEEGWLHWLFMDEINKFD